MYIHFYELGYKMRVHFREHVFACVYILGISTIVYFRIKLFYNIPKNLNNTI